MFLDTMLYTIQFTTHRRNAKHELEHREFEQMPSQRGDVLRNVVNIHGV